MFIAITGTPGTGKTEVCKVLLRKGYKLLNLNKVSNNHKFIVGYDFGRKTNIINIAKLDKFIKTQKSRDLVFLEGHFSHLLSADVVIVLRCHPKELEKRLKKKRYNPEKIRENLEAEALDVITIESAQRHKKVYEIDTTKLKPKQTADAIIKIISGEFKKYEVGNIDWSEEILSWY